MHFTAETPGTNLNILQDALIMSTAHSPPEDILADRVCTAVGVNIPATEFAYF